jgi:hypothetical protein
MKVKGDAKEGVCVFIGFIWLSIGTSGRQVLVNIVMNLQYP